MRASLARVLGLCWWLPDAAMVESIALVLRGPAVTEVDTIAVDRALCDAEVVTRAPVFLFGMRDRVGLTALHTRTQRSLPIVAKALRRLGVEPSGPPVTLYRPCGDGSFEMTIAYPTAEPLVIGKPFVAARLPGGRAVQAMHLGSWQTLLSSYDRLSEWLAAHRVLSVPLMWEEYVVLAGDPAGWQTRVVVPLRPETELAAPAGWPGPGIVST